jgi:competence protein ComEA
MLKKVVVLLALLVPVWGAWAAVDVNTATEAQLQDLKGIGPSTARAIVKERTDRGPYKDADDLSSRVKGLGAKSLSKLEAQGLEIGETAAPAGKGKSAAPGESDVRPAAKNAAGKK